ncbi:MAG TPA: flagellar protein FlaG [Candidatus Baltobacteraceae bacterium]|nr:flagellar protein FlaG [Candidatus Baltobacteraceae bacterium]
MDVPQVGAAEAVPQQAPPVAVPQGGGQQKDGLPPAPAGTSNSGPLSSIVAKLFAQDGAVKSESVSVSYRVEHDPNIIVTIFTDPTTGQEIAQIPPEVMVQFAQFFDKESGVTLDRSA